MTVSQALSEGLQVTVIGLIIVFAVLVILMLVLMAMKAIFYKPETENNSKSEPVNNVQAINTSANENASIDEEELIAVLTAAVAASLNTSTYNLNIKSYRRIGNASPSWNTAGLSDVINSRF